MFFLSFFPSFFLGCLVACLGCERHVTNFPANPQLGWKQSFPFLPALPFPFLSLWNIYQKPASGSRIYFHSDTHTHTHTHGREKYEYKPNADRYLDPAAIWRRRFNVEIFGFAESTFCLPVCLSLFLSVCVCVPLLGVGKRHVTTFRASSNLCRGDKQQCQIGNNDASRQIPINK